MNNPTQHECPVCGYIWPHGQHGGHSCTDRLLLEIAGLKRGLIRFDFINADGQPDSKMITHDEMRERYSAACAPVVEPAYQTCNGKSCGWCKEGAKPCLFTEEQRKARDALSAPGHGEQVRADAERFNKLLGWMSSNVADGWNEVCRVSAVATYVSHDEARAYLDDLPQCSVGLAAAPSAGSQGGDA